MRRLLLVSAGVIGLWTHSAHAQCPAAIPNPADTTAVMCFTVNKPIEQRCASPIDPTQCDRLNSTAFGGGLLTLDGYNYLQSIGFCSILSFFPPTVILDFCPRGCFAADTQLLSSIGSDGEADYVKAASVVPNSPLMSMADEASLGEVLLAPQSVKRIVVGPEDPQLFVFTLANGHTLRVTQHHPMVLDDGTIIEARKVTKKMSFVGLDGQSVAVTKITRAKPAADVFSFETAGTTQLSHIIVAEGVLVGDLKIQNELESEEASIGLRR